MFLGAAMRLVDLHDTARSPGNDVLVQPPEHRRGNSQGLYLTLGWRILEELRDQELTGKTTFVDLIPFARRAAADFGVSEEDVKQVVRMLATPTELRFMDYTDSGLIPVSTKTTALIDKKRRGYHCRLSRTGREALQFANGYLKWVHIPHEAAKLVTDLQMSEFRSFIAISQRVWLQVRDQSAEIIKALEQPEAEALREHFTRHHDRYLQTLEETARVMGECQSLLRRQELTDAINAWADEDAEMGASVEHFFYITREINSATLALQRRFSTFLTEVQKRSRSYISGVRFEDMARRFVALGRNPLTRPEVLEDIHGRLGPLSIEAEHFYIMDLARSVARPKERDRPPPPRLQIRKTRSKRLPILEQFIAANRDALLAILDNGPLKLTNFFEDEYDLAWSALGEEGQLVDALGVFTSPLTMNVHDDRPGKAILVKPLPVTRFETHDGWRVSGHAVELSLVDQKQKKKACDP